jgi:uncharacterized protein (DUF885 family)
VQYAERLAYELGWYADDPYSDLGRLQYELLRAVRLVVDTGLHEQRWAYAQAVAYMNENTGFPTSALDVSSQVVRYLCMPGQATAYGIGMGGLHARTGSGGARGSVRSDRVPPNSAHRRQSTAAMLSQFVQARDPQS